MPPVDMKKLEKTLQLEDGTRVLLRPFEAKDVDNALEAFKTLSKGSRYLRFSKISERLSRESLLKALDVDYVRRVEILAVIEDDGEEIIGEAGYARDEDGSAAEMGILVRDDWQGRGIGTELLRHIVTIARWNGVSRLFAFVDANNRAAVELGRKAGFKLAEDSGVGDRTILKAELIL